MTSARVTSSARLLATTPDVVLLGGMIVLLAAAGCARSAGRVTPAPEDHRIHAVVGFRQLGAGEVLYALRDPGTVSWSFAPAIRIPATGPFAIHGAGSPDSSQRPLVILLRGRSVEHPRVDASLLEVGFAVEGAAVDGDPIAHPCLGDSWLAAFFLEGFGPRPIGDVVIHYTTDGTSHRLRVDPTRHTLRATPALRLSAGDADADPGFSERREISLQPSRILGSVLPLALRRDQEQWEAGGSLDRQGFNAFDVSLWTFRNLPSSMHRPRTPIQEWRLYLLEAPPPC